METKQPKHAAYVVSVEKDKCEECKLNLNWQ